MPNILDIPSVTPSKLEVRNIAGQTPTLIRKLSAFDTSRGKVHYVYCSGCAINNGSGVDNTEFGEQDLTYTPQNRVFSIPDTQFTTDDGPLQNASVPAASTPKTDTIGESVRSFEWKVAGTTGCIPWNDETQADEPTEDDLRLLGNDVAAKALSMMNDAKNKMPYSATSMTTTAVRPGRSLTEKLSGFVELGVTCTPEYNLSGGVWHKRARIVLRISESWRSGFFYLPLFKTKCKMFLNSKCNIIYGVPNASSICNKILFKSAVDFSWYYGAANTFAPSMDFGMVRMDTSGGSFYSREGEQSATLNSEMGIQGTGRLVMLTPRLDWTLPSAEAIVAAASYFDNNASRMLVTEGSHLSFSVLCNVETIVNIYPTKDYS